MSSGILFLIVPAAQEADFRTYVRDSLAAHRLSSVRILTDAVSGSYNSKVKINVSSELIDSLAAFAPDPNHRLVFHRDSMCSFEHLKKWWESQGFQSQRCQQYPHSTIKRVLKEQWEASGDHWRSHSSHQVTKFDGPKTVTNAWVQQFAELGFPNVGKKLAAQIRVVRIVEMPSQPYTLRRADVLGLRQASCYVEDNDSGGSWQDVKLCLSHSHPTGSFYPVFWNKSEQTLRFPEVDVDQYVLYEDGLWTGFEGVRRLNALKKAPPNARVILKYAIVSDFGLHIVRHAIRDLGLSDQVQIDASASEFMKFLPDDLPEELQIGRDMSSADYTKALQDHTIPFAFNSSQEWKDEEKEVCRDIGSQLVKFYFARKDSTAPLLEFVDQYALGFRGFASTTLFCRSVPKVCLPVLWGEGPVRVGDKEVNWLPLFGDARRGSDLRMLYAAPLSKS